MNTTTKTRNSTLLLSILGAGVVALLGGCAEGPYMTAYDTGYYPAATYRTYQYNAYPAYPYSYYGQPYDGTVVRSGVRYYDAYGARYGGTVTGSDNWY